MEHFLVKGDERRPACLAWSPDVLTGSDDNLQWYGLSFKQPFVGLQIQTTEPSAKFMGLTSQVQTSWSRNGESEKAIKKGNGLLFP